MKNQIDKLFKEKIEHHLTPVPTEAWAKIEATLPKKNKSLFSWRIAAVLALVGALLFVLYWGTSTNENRPPVMVEKRIELPTKGTEKKVKELPVATLEENSTVKPTRQNSPHSLPQRKSEIEKTTIAENKTTEIIQEKQNERGETNVQPIDEMIASAKTEKSIVLEFTLASVETPARARAEDVAEERNPNLKKVWTIAKDLKNGESVLDLNNLKENLFAHNPKKDKLRNNQ
jgi:hypothetical protein